jgi:hypothetical protein
MLVMTNLAIALITALQMTVTEVNQDRLRVISQDMISVVEQEFLNSSLKSGMTKEEALHILAAVAVGESNLRSDIETCKVTGDKGRSIGLGQIMRGPNWRGMTRKQICNDRQAQLRLSLHVIDMCWEKTPNANASLRCYTSGNPYKDSYAARHEFDLYRKISKVVSKNIVEQKIRTCSIAQNYSRDYSKFSYEL